MAKEKKDLRKELRSYKFDFDLLQKIPCTRQENKEYKQLREKGELPKGVYEYQYEGGTDSGEFYTIYEPELTPEEIAEYLTYKKLSLLKTIKNCVVFFTVLTIISLAASLLLIMAA